MAGLMKGQILMDQVCTPRIITITGVNHWRKFKSKQFELSIFYFLYDRLGGVDLSSVAKEIGQDGSSAGTAALETALDGLPPK